MLKKTSQFKDKDQSSHSDSNTQKKQKIQWDEVTIAEHDKERGSRQKIDEAPTPYRYMSESESEYSSDGEHLARCRAG
jgi:protein phosphatase inhibitor 2